MREQDSDRVRRIALLVVDVQQGLFNRPKPIYEAEKLLDNINVLIDRAHGEGLPVCFIQHANKSMLVEGSENWQLHPRLHRREDDLLFHKQQGSAFAGTELERVLVARGIDELWITGLVSHGCVKATCLDAHDRGFAVTLVEDGHSNFHGQAPKMIVTCNRQLSEQGVVTLAPTRALFVVPITAGTVESPMR